MNFNFTISKKELTILSMSWIVVTGLCVLGWVGYNGPDFTPAKNRHGWSPVAFESEETAEIVGQMDPFQIVGEDGERIVQDNSSANVRLWDAVLSIRGQHLDNVPQQIGDCVSWAYCNAAEILIYVEMRTGSGGEFHELFPPYIYGTSRVQIGRGRVRGDGSCMAWAVQAGRQYGVLRADAEGVPQYSGKIAREWGSKGPPKDLIEATKMYSVGTASRVATADEIRDAICNGYPVPFGAGGIGWDRVKVQYGRLVGIRSGSWAHAQCVIGYDGTQAEPLYCILNSWGPRAGGRTPIDGSPPGSYWITKRDMEYVARQGDAFAVSNFAGFKAREIDFKLTKSQAKEPQKRKENNRASLAQAL